MRPWQKILISKNYSSKRDKKVSIEPFISSIVQEDIKINCRSIRSLINKF